MAEEIVLGIKVQGSNSLASLKKEFKDLQIELGKTEQGSKEYIETLKKLGAVKDDIGDLRDTINALNPEGKVAAFSKVASKLAGGFQAATGAAALFGTESENLQKSLLKVQAATAFAEGITSIAGLSDGFKVLGTVIKSNPILLIGTVIVGIGTVLFALKDKIAVVGEAFNLLGKGLGKIVDFVKDFTDSIGLSSFAMDDLTAKMDKFSKKSLEGADVRQRAYAREIALLKAQGKETSELEKQALNDRLLADASRIDSLKKQAAIGKKLSDEEKKEKDELVQKILDTNNEIKIIDATNEKERQEKARAAAEARAQADREALAKKQRDEDAAKKLSAEGKLKAEREAKEAADKLEKEKKEALDTRLGKIRSQEVYYAKTQKEDAAAAKAEKQIQDDARIQAEANTIAAFGLLSDAYFQTKLNGAKGNAAEELKIRKQQFQVEKAFSIARVIIDGIRSVQSALIIPAPFGPILAASNGLLAAANLAKIMSTQFDGGGNTPLGSLSTPPAANGAVIPTNAGGSQLPTRQDETNINAQGYANRVVLVETDVTKSQNRVNKLKMQASF